jgi:hypothetical protein
MSANWIINRNSMTSTPSVHLPAPPPAPELDKAKRAILRVGGGRGFVVEHRTYVGSTQRIVITAAHCLPCLPPAHPAAFGEELTYPTLIGPLGGKRTVCAECLFIDPVADIAVLGSPNSTALLKQADAYDRLLEDMESLCVTDAPEQGEEPHTFRGLKVRRPTPGKGPAYVLSLRGRWLGGEVHRTGWLAFEPQSFVKSGMSGSPILSPAGEAIGLVSTGSMNPALMECLPARLRLIGGK